jgi:hypothetical protein
MVTVRGTVMVVITISILLQVGVTSQAIIPIGLYLQVIELPSIL